MWYAAVTQSFFSLSVGFGTLTTYSSYNKVPAYIYNKVLAYIYMSHYTHMTAIIQGHFLTAQPTPLSPFPRIFQMSAIRKVAAYIHNKYENMRLKTNRFMSVLPLDLCLFFRRRREFHSRKIALHCHWAVVTSTKSK